MFIAFSQGLARENALVIRVDGVNAITGRTRATIKGGQQSPLDRVHT